MLFPLLIVLPFIPPFEVEVDLVVVDPVFWPDIPLPPLLLLTTVVVVLDPALLPLLFMVVPPDPLLAMLEVDLEVEIEVVAPEFWPDIPEPPLLLLTTVVVVWDPILLPLLFIVVPLDPLLAVLDVDLVVEVEVVAPEF